MHVMWSEVHEEGGGGERRWIYMRSVRETRVFIFLHTCVFNVLPYIHRPGHITFIWTHKYIIYLLLDLYAWLPGDYR